MTRYLIMCQGRGTRWQKEHPKCLCEIAGETLIERIMRQLHERGETDVIAVGEHKWLGDFGVYEIPHTEPEVCHGIHDTKHLWGSGDVVILLGDTFYSDELMDVIVNCRDEVRVFGRVEPHALSGKIFSERYAVRFTPQARNFVEESLDVALGQKTIAQSLRAWYYGMINAPFIPKDKRQYHDNFIFHEVNDVTDDIDTVEEYNVMKEKIEALVATKIPKGA